MINIRQNKRRVAIISTAAFAIFVVIYFLWQCSLNPLSGFDIRYGLCESNFKLAKESRLPKWIRLPIGVDRSEITVDFVYFLYKTKVAATNKKNNQIFFTATADSRHHPITIEKSNTMQQGWPCPSYNIISVAGVEEIVEHAERGDVVHIVEPAQVTHEIYNNDEMKKRCETLRYSD